MRRNVARWLALAGAMALAACATDRSVPGGRTVSDTPVKVGAPYRAGGRLWVPADDRGYDAIGLASWYGGAHAGRPTANGERFDPRGISAAHPTLPLPSYVEVTALDSGRTILTRVNDRGPFVASRIIDLSAGAAKALGIERQGVARVRVRRVQPPEADRAALRAGRAARARPDASRQVLAGLVGRLDAGPAIPRMTTTVRRDVMASSGRTGVVPDAVAAAPAAAGGIGGVAGAGASSASPAGRVDRAGLAASARVGDAGLDMAGAPVSGMIAAGRAGSDAIAGPTRPAVTAGSRTVPPTSQASGPATSLYVRVAMLDDADRADGLAATLAAIGPATATPAGSGWQVRLGPYADAASARSALARVLRAGYQEARIVSDSAQRQEHR